MNSYEPGHEWDGLLDRHLRGELDESEQERLAELLDREPSLRETLVEQSMFETRIGEVLRSEGGDQESRSPVFLRAAPATWKPLAVALLAIAALVVVVVSIQTAFQQPYTTPIAEQKIALITGLSGPLQWTGNGGRVFQDLVVGTKLSGGTIDGLSPESWFELEFNDGSRVVISGNSMLTYSDLGQKVLHLKGGSFSASVEPQPINKPMLIHTRSAILEVLGTEFEVEAGVASTYLNVSKGKVRLKRLSDGNSIDVPAKHRVIAAADRDLALERVPDTVDHWQSQMQRGPEGLYGKWSPKADDEDARLKAIPYTTEKGMTIYAASMGVSSGDNPPVVVRKGSTIRVRGRIVTQARIWFGITLRHSNGDFAGRFQTLRPAKEFPGGQEFEVKLDLQDYELDPSLDNMKTKLPSGPFDLILGDIWCHSLFDQAGLEIMEMELVGPGNTPQE